MNTEHKFNEHEPIQLVINLSDISSVSNIKLTVNYIIKDALVNAFNLSIADRHYDMVDEIVEKQNSWSLNPVDTTLYVLISHGLVYRKETTISIAKEEFTGIKKVYVLPDNIENLNTFIFSTAPTESNHVVSESNNEQWVKTLTVNDLMRLAKDWDLDITVSSEGLHVLDGESDRQADLTFDEFKTFIDHKESNISEIMKKFK